MLKRCFIDVTTMVRDRRRWRLAMSVATRPNAAIPISPGMDWVINGLHCVAASDAGWAGASTLPLTPFAYHLAPFTLAVTEITP